MVTLTRLEVDTGRRLHLLAPSPRDLSALEGLDLMHSGTVQDNVPRE